MLYDRPRLTNRQVDYFGVKKVVKPLRRRTIFMGMAVTGSEEKQKKIVK